MDAARGNGDELHGRDQESAVRVDGDEHLRGGSRIARDGVRLARGWAPVHRPGRRAAHFEYREHHVDSGEVAAIPPPPNGSMLLAMAVNSSFRSFVLDQLSRITTGVRARSMFGGVGIYARDVFFALIDGDTLYLKVDDTNRGDFEARGLGRFRPFGEGGETMQYYALDESLIEDLDELRRWSEKAIAVAVSKKAAKRKPASKRGPTAKKPLTTRPKKRR